MGGVVDLGSVPGVGASDLAALNRVGLSSSSDLLRTNRAALSSAEPGLKIAKILKWQSYCQFLEIEEITPDAAAALMAAGIDRLDEFAGKTLGALKAVFANLTQPLTDDQIVSALQSAKVLQYTGVLNGTVVTTGDAPLEGATAVAGGQSAVTDARGRFRITCLRLDLPYAVTISHPQKRSKTFNRVAVHPSNALIGRQFRLTGRPQPVTRLSSLNGDKLPPLGTAPVTTEARSEALTPNDRYVLAEFYANGDGKLGSLFLDFDAGRFVVRTYRVKKADLPAGAKLKDRMLLEGGALKIARITAGKIGRLARVQAVKNRYAGKTMTKDMIDEAGRLLAKALSDP